ncbi:MAG: hypothetical protein ACI3X6_02135 [Alloprevotella sp.]
MKRRLYTLVLTVSLALGLSAMPYSVAREQALYLTDKMAYELRLNSWQYEQVYQTNLDYFLSIDSEPQAYGAYWTYRNDDLYYILQDAQYRLYSTIDYFLRPIKWLNGGWHFTVCNHYRPGHYYYKRPVAYVSYCGKSWEHRKPGHRPNYHAHHDGHNAHHNGYRPNGGGHSNGHSGGYRPDNSHKPGAGKGNHGSVGGGSHQKPGNSGSTASRPNFGGGNRGTVTSRPSGTPNRGNSGNLSFRSNSGSRSTRLNSSSPSRGSRTINTNTGRSLSRSL